MVGIRLNRFSFFLILAFIINLIQAYFTPLIQDEAYYFMFSKHLDWGFFDSPPMVALIIKMSSLLFSDELGVRFITTCLNVLNIYLIWTIIPESNKNKKFSVELFFLILFALPLFNVYSFITTPDVPLLLFCTIFLVLIVKLIHKPNYLLTIALGFIASLIIYSKYHGAIFILLCVLSHLELLKKKYIYIAGLIASLLVIPHLYWQYQNDFISFQYHLLQRNKIGFDIFHLVHGALSIFAVLNPFLLLAMFFALKSPRNKFKLKNNYYVKLFCFFTLFFLIYSIRARIEAHWVALSSIPLLLIIHDFTLSNNLTKRISMICYSTIALILIARIVIILPLQLKTEFHKQGENYFKNVRSITKDIPVLYANSYQKASKHLFYNDEVSYSLNNYLKRKNHYDILDMSQDYHNKTVYIVGNSSKENDKKFELEKNKFTKIKLVNNFQHFSKLKTVYENDNLKINSSLGEINFIIQNPYNYSFNLYDKNLSFEFFIHFVNSNGEKFTYAIEFLNTEIINPGINKITASYDLKKLPNDIYTYSILMGANNLHPQSLGLKRNIIEIDFN